LNQLADQIEANTTFEIAIVTVQSTGGQDRLQYANMIGDENGVGKKDTDNGIVVLWSVEADAGGAIATGRGSESFVTDAVTGRIGRASRQYFDKGEYYNGMNYIVIELDKEIIKHQTPINNSDAGNPIDIGGLPDWTWIVILSIGFVIIIFKLFNVFNNSDDSSDDYSDEPEEGDKGYWRKQVYKRNGKWYHSETDRSYATASAAAAALAIMSNSDNDSEDDDDSSSSSSGSSGRSSGGFSGGSFGGGGSGF
jgi:uncharacterized protein